MTNQYGTHPRAADTPAMRIALLTHQWPGARLGGIGVYTQNCARALAQAGHDVHVFTFTLPAAKGLPPAPGVTVHQIPELAQRVHDNSVPAALVAAIHAGGEAAYRLAMGALLCAQVREAHAQSPFDILEGPEYEALALPLMLSPPPDLPIVTHLHSGSAIVRRGNQSPLSADQLLKESMEFAAILAADALCAPSAQVISDTALECPVQGAAVLLLPFYPLSAAADPAPRPAGPILYIGRLETVKGAHLLPEALNAFLAQCPDASVRIIGPDTATAPEGQSMTRWIQSRLTRQAAARTAFAGEQTREELAAELANASFTIVPSLFESYSYVCCESLAAGRPVIVSDRTGAAEVVGSAGLPFERASAPALAAAMQKLWSDRDLAARLSVLAHDRARTTLASENTIQQRLAFYAQVCHRHRHIPRPPLADRLAHLPAHALAPLLQSLAHITAFAAGVPDPAIQTPGLRLAAIMNQMRARTGRPAQIWLYGAGRHSARLLAEKHLWEQHGHRVVGLIDDHPRFRQSPASPAPMHLGLPVESLAAFASRPAPAKESQAIVLSTDAFQEQFWTQTAPLRAQNIPVYRLYE